jgi:hypothetical protein
LGGVFCLPRAGDHDGPTGGEEAAIERLDDGGGSGGAPVSSGRGCHGRRGRRPAATRACQAPSDPKGQRKQAGGLAFTGGDGSTAAAGTRGGGAVKLVLGVCVSALQRQKGGTGVRARA